MIKEPAVEVELLFPLTTSLCEDYSQGRDCLLSPTTLRVKVIYVTFSDTDTIVCSTDVCIYLSKENTSLLPFHTSEL